MLQHKAYRFRIYPSKEQQILIAKTIGCARFVFNHFLAMWNDTYQESSKGLTYRACSTMLPKMKHNVATFWLKEVDSIAIQSSIKNLADGFTRFFQKQNKQPIFKSKNNPVQSYTTKYTNGNILIDANTIKLPKMGYVKFAKSRVVKGRIINATIKRNPSDKYFVSLLFEEDIQPLPRVNAEIGVDLGITDFAVFSSGEKKITIHSLLTWKGN